MLRTKSKVAIHGDTAGNRISADAVGRRGGFAEGQFPTIRKVVAPPENAPSGAAPPRPRRPGIKSRVRDTGTASANSDRIRRQRPGQRAASDSSCSVGDRGIRRASSVPAYLSERSRSNRSRLKAPPADCPFSLGRPARPESDEGSRELPGPSHDRPPLIHAVVSRRYRQSPAE